MDKVVDRTTNIDSNGYSGHPVYSSKFIIMTRHVPNAAPINAAKHLEHAPHAKYHPKPRKSAHSQCLMHKNPDFHPSPAPNVKTAQRTPNHPSINTPTSNAPRRAETKKKLAHSRYSWKTPKHFPERPKNSTLQLHRHVEIPNSVPKKKARKKERKKERIQGTTKKPPMKLLVNAQGGTH